MTRLNQIIAIRKGVMSQYGRWRDAMYHQAQKPGEFSGIIRSYRPRDDDGDQLPPESTRVQMTTEELMRQARDALTRMWDVTLTQDAANCLAKADIAVDGTAVLKNVPAVYLLFLEKQLVDVRTIIGKMPLLDPAQEWHWDETKGCWATPSRETVRTRKVMRNHEVSPATDKHPAQVQVYTEDVPVGDWATVSLSGAMPAARQRELLNRVEELLGAVKFARETANMSEVTDQHAGKPVFDWLMR